MFNALLIFIIIYIHYLSSRQLSNLFFASPRNVIIYKQWVPLNVLYSTSKNQKIQKVTPTDRRLECDPSVVLKLLLSFQTTRNRLQKRVNEETGLFREIHLARSFSLMASRDPLGHSLTIPIYKPRATQSRNTPLSFRDIAETRE